jgi:hypothetical protein
MLGRPRRSLGRSTARVALVVVFALGVVAGPLGAVAITPTTMDSPLAPERVSIATDGTQGNDWSGVPSMSDDGRYVAWQSDATNLAGEDVNGTTQDVYYRDRVTNETTMVSSVRADAVDWDRGSRSPSVSDDGRYVAFISGKDLVASDTNGGGGPDSGTGIDLYIKDMQTGTFQFCDLVGDGSASADRDSYPWISGDGKFVVVGSNVDIAPEDDNGYLDVYRYDVESGETTLVSPIDTLDYWNYDAKPIGISVAFFSAVVLLVGTEGPAVTYAVAAIAAVLAGTVALRLQAAARDVDRQAWLARARADARHASPSVAMCSDAVFSVRVLNCTPQVR